jgi:hypothetical protein
MAGHRLGPGAHFMCQSCPAQSSPTPKDDRFPTFSGFCPFVARHENLECAQLQCVKSQSRDAAPCLVPVGPCGASAAAGKLYLSPEIAKAIATLKLTGGADPVK